MFKKLAQRSSVLRHLHQQQHNRNHHHRAVTLVPLQQHLLSSPVLNNNNNNKKNKQQQHNEPQKLRHYSSTIAEQQQQQEESKDYSMSKNNSSSQQQQKNSKQQQHNEAAEAAATQEKKKQKQPFTNRLAHEKSPYLIQHQHNPVDWYPWGNEAFEKAKKEDKLIFLSVGYSTCHWCHVMQHESFENVQIANLMNDYFVNIKVDREERPDVDRVYMTYVQATTGHGGWPMSVFLTSDLKPVFGGTYFPPFNHSTGGMMLGFATLLQRLHHLWQNDRKKLLDSANHVMEALKDAEVTEAITQYSSSSSSSSEAALEDNILKNSETMKMYNEQLLKHGDQYLEKCTKHLLHEFDHTHGGFGAAPKFPRPVIFNFLFHMYHRYHHQQEQQEQQQVQQQQQQQAENTTTAAADIDMDDIDGDTRMSSQILHACLHTLNQMAHGGMYDTLGYGFHRYSVDAQWHVPHFEKMLYDQAQLVHAYLDATQVTCGTSAVTSSSTVNYINTITQEQSLYARIAHQVLKYVMRDLRDLKTGAFYSAEDADSIDPHNTREKREGAFYVWTFEELQKVLSNNSASSKSGHIFTPEQIAKFCNYYSCLEQGNVPDAQDAHGEFVNQNILHVNYDNPEQINSKSGSSSSSSSTTTKSGTSTTVEPYFEEMKHHLLDYRNKTRVRPHLDDKVITSWNGIMIGAFARASRVLNIHQDMQIQQGDLLDKSHTGNASIYLQVAIDACEFLLKSVWDSNKRVLYRASRNGEANTNIPGFLTDYACLIAGLLDLYEASGNHKYAQLALEMQQAQDDIFLDKKLNYGATYYETSGNDSSILLRQKETYDGAEAAGNSITCMNLLRLSTLYDLDEYRNVAIRTLASFHKQISKIPYASPQLMCALDVLVGHQQKSADNSSNAVNAGYMKKVVLVTDGDQAESNTINALHVLSQVHEPNAVILHLNNKESRAYWTERLPYLKDLQMKDGKPTALLCMNKTCQLPTTDLPKVFSK